MAEQEISYDAIVHAEIAIKIHNHVRAIIAARVYDLEANGPAADD